MTKHDHLDPAPEHSTHPADDAGWADRSVEADLDAPEIWDDFEDSEDDTDEDPHPGGLDDLFGPWLGDEDVVPGAGWGITVPDRGFYRD